LTYKLLNAGFIREAKAEADKAMAIQLHHKNVEASLVALTEHADKEQKQVDEIQQKSKRKADFYTRLGGKLCEPDIVNLSNQWQGPACRLSVTVTGDRFTATGSYERPVNGLVGALTGISNITALEHIEYKGKIIGHRIEGKIKRWDEANRARSSSILGALIEDTKFLMIASSSKIEIMEGPTTTSPSFYELTPA